MHYIYAIEYTIEKRRSVTHDLPEIHL
jgi:hypothetical protein